MAQFDLQNQNLASLLSALGGFTGTNELTQPPLQAMPSQPQSPYAGMQPDLTQQTQAQQQINPEMVAQAANSPKPQALGFNYPESFQGFGLGDTAPKLNQPTMNPQLMYALQNLGGF